MIPEVVQWGSSLYCHPKILTVKKEKEIKVFWIIGRDQLHTGRDLFLVSGLGRDRLGTYFLFFLLFNYLIIYLFLLAGRDQFMTDRDQLLIPSPNRDWKED